MIDRIDTIARLKIAYFPSDSLDVHKEVEQLRRVRLGSPFGIKDKLADLQDNCSTETIVCLNNAGHALLELLRQQSEFDQQQSHFWLQQRMHLLPYFDLTGDVQVTNSKRVVSVAMELPWFFYLIYSDPLI